MSSIAWIDTNVSVARSIEAIYSVLDNVPLIEEANIPRKYKNNSDLIREFTIEKEGVKVPFRMEIDIMRVHRRIIALRPYSHRMRKYRNSTEYEDSMIEQARKVAARQLYHYLKSIVEIMQTEAIDVITGFLPYMVNVDDRSERLIDTFNESMPHLSLFTKEPPLLSGE